MGTALEDLEVRQILSPEGQVDPAKKSVHARLLLDAVAMKEGLDVADKEVDERIAMEARRMGESPDKLKQNMKQGSGMEALKNQLLREKSLDLLMAVANIQNEE